jgi:hypothetical protein
MIGPMIGRRGCLLACVLVGSVAYADDKPSIGDQVDEAVDTGDAWNVAIPKLAAILGAPQLAKDDRIEWARMVDDMCAHVVLKADADGFVQSFNTTESSKLDTEGWPPCKKLIGKKAKIPAKLRGPKPLDADALATTLVDDWGAGKFDELFKAAHPGMQESLGSPAVLAWLAKIFEERAGKFVKLGTPFEHAFKDSSWVVSAPLVYEKGTLHVALSFVPASGKILLTNFDLRLPKELQAHPDPKDAAREARADLDLLLAAKTDAMYQHMHWELAKKLPRAALDPQLADILKQLGKVQSIKQVEQTTCDDRQCFTFEVKGAHGTSKATFDMTFFVAEWIIYGFDLEPPQ